MQLGKHEVTGFIPWILPALQGHQNLSSPGQPLGGNLTINESRAGGGLKVGDGECGPGRMALVGPNSSSWNRFYLSHALVRGERDGVQQYVLWGSAQANFT